MGLVGRWVDFFFLFRNMDELNMCVGWFVCVVDCFGNGKWVVIFIFFFSFLNVMFFFISYGIVFIFLLIGFFIIYFLVGWYWFLVCLYNGICFFWCEVDREKLIVGIYFL